MNRDDDRRLTECVDRRSWIQERIKAKTEDHSRLDLLEGDVGVDQVMLRAHRVSPFLPKCSSEAACRAKSRTRSASALDDPTAGEVAERSVEVGVVRIHELMPPAASGQQGN